MPPFGTGREEGAGTPEPLRESRRLHQVGQSLIETPRGGAAAPAGGGAGGGDEAGRGRRSPAPEGEVVRLQLLLQSRDKHLDELTAGLRRSQTEAAEAKSEVEVLRQQVRVLKKDVAERTEEMVRQLRAERDMRAEVFQLQARLEKAAEMHQDESRRSAAFAQGAATAEDRQRRIDQLEHQLAEEVAGARRQREQLAAESEHRLNAKEQTIKHQTATIDSLNRELKEKQAEVDKLLRLGCESPTSPTDRGVLQPLGQRGEDIPGQRSVESLHKQLKAKDTKIAKQAERLQALSEMLERRDQQLEELATAKRDREKWQQKFTEMEDVLKTQPRVATHTEAQRRLIEQEQQILYLSKELKEKQAEVEKLLRLPPAPPPSTAAPSLAPSRAAAVATPGSPPSTSRGLLKDAATTPQPQSPRGEDPQSQRALQQLQLDVRAKEAKLDEQGQRLQVLTEMLERRDQQLEELGKLRSEKDKMQQKYMEMEDALKSQARMVTHTEAERRLIEQEQKIERLAAASESVERELDAKRGEVDRLRQAMEEHRQAAVERAVPAPPPAAPAPPPPPQDQELQRSLESLKQQLKRKEGEMADQAGRLQALADVLQKRDQQLEEALKMQPRSAEAQGEAERRALDAERRAMEAERRAAEQAERKLSEQEGTLKQQAAIIDSLNRELKERHLQAATAADLAAATAREQALSELLQKRDQQLQEALVAQPRSIAAQTEAERRAAEAERRAAEAEGRAVEEVERKLHEQEQAMRQQAAIIESLNRELRESHAQAAAAAAAAAQAAREQAHALALAQAAQPQLQAPPSPQSARERMGSPAVHHRRMRDASTNTTPAPLAARELPPPTAAAPVGQDASRPLALQQPPPRTRTSLQGPGTGIEFMSPTELRNLSAEDLRNELLARRRETDNLESQLEDKKHLVLKLIEEANLCNAEVASLQQTVQQAYKAARKQDRDYEKLLEERNELEDMANSLRKALDEKETRLTNLFTEHQRDISGNAAVDELDQKVSWKLRVLTPRQHEIRNSIFLVLNRRSGDILDKIMLAHGLAGIFAISNSRIEIVEDARLPDSAGEDAVIGGIGGAALAEAAALRTPSNHSDSPRGPGTPLHDDYPEGLQDGMDGELTIRRDLVLVNISDSEMNAVGQLVRSAVSAVDVMDQVREEMLRGQRPGPIEGMTVDAVFINHGDAVLPYEWPFSQAQLLLREGRVIAGKHAVVTVHEVRDPYVLRVVAYDTEVGREFVLYLNTRDVFLLLDTRDCELQSQADLGDGSSYRHLQGALAHRFREACTVADQDLLDVIVSSLSFSVFQSQQILVASEMRVPVFRQTEDFPQVDGTLALANEGSPAARDLALLEATHPSTAMAPPAPALPDRGITRGMRPQQVETKRLYEDVLGFEGRLCVLSITHTTTPDLQQDVLKAVVYYPKTSSQVEACLVQPMVSDRMRIVSEVGELDAADQLCVAIVVEELIYPPSFVVRLTSITLNDVHALSPGELSKPHCHIIRVTKDGNNAMHLPDMSFAMSHSTMRSKLIRCIGLSTPVQGPRETLLKLPAAKAVTGEEVLVRRTVTGHVSERFGLTVHLTTAKSKTAKHGPMVEGEKPPNSLAAGAMPPALRAHLRAKHGKGRLLVRRGRRLPLQGAATAESVRAVVSVYERSQPYQHFVMCAYEPQTSREWEVLADSIDIFKLFADQNERRSQALDLGNPATREKLANLLVDCLELTCCEEEILLQVSPSAVREQMDLARKEEKVALADKGRAPEVTGSEDPDPIKKALPASNSKGFEVHPVATNVLTRAIGGFDGNHDREVFGSKVETELLIEQKYGDRLFVAQRRLAPQGVGAGDLYKIGIYDAPLPTTLHSYIVLATPLNESTLAVQGLPQAILADPSSPTPTKPTLKTYTLRIDDRLLDDFLLDASLLEPTRQEELLDHISHSLHLDEDRNGQLRMGVRKKKLRAHQIPDAVAQIGETGSKNPASHVPLQDGPAMPTGRPGCREVGGSFTLSAVRPKDSRSTEGPSLFKTDGNTEGQRKLLMRDWKKVYCMAQRFGSYTIMITVSKRHLEYKLGVYEPETSSLYEMTLVTCSSTAPLNLLMERCDLGGKLDIMLCMHEVAFPHQLSVHIVHIPTSQEFNLKIGDDLVYPLTENSRKEAFLMYFDQLITWGCIGFSVPPGTEEQALPNVFEETFAGHQIFDRTQIEDVLQNHLVATVENGEMKHPVALPPPAPKKIRVPVIRTQLDFLGKKTQPPAGITMHLLYHGEHCFPQENSTVLLRVHKRVSTNEIAVTLRVKTAEGLSLPQAPVHRHMAAASSANGRSFDTPALAGAEGHTGHLKEVTVWVQDKCSRCPCGIYGEFCDVPGFSKPVLLLISDEDAPRAIRVAATLAVFPFTVLFQVVLLETSETAAKVESTSKPTSTRKVLQQTIEKFFGTGKPNSVVSAHLARELHSERDRDLRKKLDDVHASRHGGGGKSGHVGVEYGHGLGGPAGTGTEAEEAISTAALHICTRMKLGRMMVFTVYRDLVDHNMYLRVVMHDPSAQRDCHLTLLHYTTQRLLERLHIDREMLEDTKTPEFEGKQEKLKARRELGNVLVDHLYLRRSSDKEGMGEEIDHLELPEDEEIEYELRMRDFMDPATAAAFSARKRLLDSARTAQE